MSFYKNYPNRKDWRKPRYRQYDCVINDRLALLKRKKVVRWEKEQRETVDYDNDSVGR